MSVGYSQSLAVLAQKLHTQNLTLQQAEDVISIKEKKIEVSDSWDNPYLTVGANDLLIDDITVRDREAMQAQFVSISQKIPLGDKTGIKKKIAQTDSEVSKLLYDEKLLKLRSQLFRYGYKVAILDKKLALVQKYQNNAKKLKQVQIKRFEIGKSTQSSILKAKILMQKLSIKKRKLVTQKRLFLQKIEALTYESVAGIEADLQMNKHVILSLDNHPSLKLLEKKIELSYEQLQLKKALLTSDIKVGLGYFQRDDRTDYVSLNVGMPLQFSDKEKNQKDVALIELTRAKRALKSQQFLFESRVESLKDSLDDALLNYEELQATILPKQKQMYKLLEQELFTKNISITALFENINDTIKLELESLALMMVYFDAYSELLYFEGDFS